MKEKIEELIEKVKNDKDFGEKFKSNPIQAIEEVVGVDLPDDKINEIIATVKAKVNLDKLGESKLFDKVKGLFD